jgi:hypothetical protein
MKEANGSERKPWPTIVFDPAEPLTEQELWNRDGEQLLDKFCEAIGWPNATVEDEEIDGEPHFVFRVHRDEYDAALAGFIRSVASDTERGAE